MNISDVQDEVLAKEALVTLQAISIKLSHGLTSTEGDTSLAKYLQSITKECNESLQEPQHKQAQPASRILSSVGTASDIAYYHTIKAVLPSLLTVYQAADSMASIRALLEIFVQLFDTSIVVYEPNITRVSETVVANPLSLFKDRLFDMFSKALMSTSKEEVALRVAAMRGLLRLCVIRDYLDNGEVGLFMQYCQEIYLDEEDSGRDDLKDEAIKALVQLSKLFPHQAKNSTVPVFISRLPDFCKDDTSPFLIPLQGLAQLGTQEQLFGIIVRRLLTRLDIVIQHKAGLVVYPEAILIALTYLFKNRRFSQDPNLGEHVEKIIHGLIGRAALGASKGDQATLLNDPMCLEPLGRLAGIVVHSLDEHKQRAIGARVYALEDTHFIPVPFREQAASDSERLTMIISTYLLASAGPLVRPVKVLQVYCLLYAGNRTISFSIRTKSAGPDPRAHYIELSRIQSQDTPHPLTSACPFD